MSPTPLHTGIHDEPSLENDQLRQDMQRNHVDTPPRYKMAILLDPFRNMSLLMFLNTPTIQENMLT